MDRQSQMQIDQTSKANHRQYVKDQKTKIEQKKRIFPEFINLSTQGRVVSHQGKRVKLKKEPHLTIQQYWDKSEALRSTNKKGSNNRYTSFNVSTQDSVIMH